MQNPGLEPPRRGAARAPWRTVSLAAFAAVTAIGLLAGVSPPTAAFRGAGAALALGLATHLIAAAVRCGDAGQR